MLSQDACIFGVIAGQVAIGPAAPVFERLRKIPVIDGAKRPEAILEHRIDQSAVVIDALHVGGACSGRLNAGPGDGKTIALLIETPGQGEVLRVEVVLITGDIARGASLHLAGRMCKAVPDGFALAIFLPGAFHLVGCSGSTPQETVRKLCILSLGPGNRAGYINCL